MMFDKAEMSKRQEKLTFIRDELKKEFFGIDDIIDRVISLMRAWYLMPSLITRPVIINLWGLTGVGKTQLVRRIVQMLDYSNKFLEVQMDGFSTGDSYTTTIHGLLNKSSIGEGEPGIVLLDEMQRYRTIDNFGADIKVERYQDVWMLLSDGKFSIDFKMFADIEMMLAEQMYRSEKKKDNPDEKTIDTKYKIYPYEASYIKRRLRRNESIEEIMKWSFYEIDKAISELKTENTEVDYTKLLIFVSGNLDEMFNLTGKSNDSDTDADVYHELTKKLNTSDVKNALSVRFKPEQISRFGNNNIIYPSLSKNTYKNIIKYACLKYIDEMHLITNIQFSISDNLYQEIYTNSVYPTQGTRPVYSTIHQILGSSLSDIGLWALENNHNKIHLDIDVNKKCVIALTPTGMLKEFPVLLEIRENKEKSSVDFNTMVAVHEIGHALTYAALFQVPPQDIKINLFSYSGGFIIQQDVKVLTKDQILDRICVCLAGSVAEEIVFGTNMRTNGNGSDNENATALAAKYVRRYGFDGYVSSFSIPFAGDAINYNTNVKNTDDVIEQILKEQRNRCNTLLTNHREIFIRLVDMLRNNSFITPDEFRECVKDDISLSETTNVIPKFDKMWEIYSGKR